MAMLLYRDWDYDEGLNPVDLLAPFIGPHLNQRKRLRPSHYRPWRMQHSSGDNGYVAKNEKDQFQVNLDIQQFTPEEVQVKVVENCIVVEAKHEEKEDEHGFISRQFVRRYVLPEDYDIQHVASSLSSDGILTITAPKIKSVENNERIIPITHTGLRKSIKRPADEDDKCVKKSAKVEKKRKHK